MIAEFPPALILWLGAFLLPLIPRGIRPWAFLLFPLASLYMIMSLPAGTTVTLDFLRFELHVFEMTQLSRVFGIIFSLIGVIAGIYALHMKELGQQTAALLYGGGALCVTFAGDYYTLFVGWEIMAIGSTYLIWARRTNDAQAAGMRYLLAHLLGGSLLLAGIILQVSSSGSILIRPFASGESLAAWLILAGVALNAAVPPLHAWLTDAYPRATITGVIFMSSLTTKSAVYVLASQFAGWDILLYLGVVMALYGAIYALLANDIRELLANSIISQVGYMVTAIGIGTALAINGTAAHAFSHILYKALLMMAAGVVIHTTGKSKLSELGGLYRYQKTVFALYMVGAFSIAGLPLFNGFISKSIIITAAGESHYEKVMLLLLLASVASFIHTGLRLPYWTWHGHDRGLDPARAPGNMIAAMGITAFLCILFGVYPDLLYRELPFGVAYRPYTAPHLVESVQLLTFTFIAFWLFRNKLTGQAQTALDIDWFYRSTRPFFQAVFVTSINRFFAACERQAFALAGRVIRLSVNPLQVLRTWRFPEREFDPDRDRPPLGIPLAMTLLVAVLAAAWSLWS